MPELRLLVLSIADESTLNEPEFIYLYSAAYVWLSKLMIDLAVCMDDTEGDACNIGKDSPAALWVIFDW